MKNTKYLITLLFVTCNIANAMDTLPPEVTTSVLNHLEFSKDIVSFGATSKLNYEIVKAFLPNKDSTKKQLIRFYTNSALSKESLFIDFLTTTNNSFWPETKDYPLYSINTLKKIKLQLEDDINQYREQLPYILAHSSCLTSSYILKSSDDVIKKSKTHEISHIKSIEKITQTKHSIDKTLPKYLKSITTDDSHLIAITNHK